MFFVFTGIVTWAIAALVLSGKFVRFLRERSRLNMNSRWVVITGCDSGIGAGVVELLVAEGAAVIACVFTAAGAARATQAGAQRVLQFDVTDNVAVKHAITQIKEATGGTLWAIVHNAGTVLPGFVEYQLLETYRRVMEVNCFAVVQLTQPLIPMLKQSNGRVVIVSSVDGIVSLPGNAPYDASKFAVEAYADALRVELSFWSVHVAVVNPSTMKTPLAMGFFEAHKTAWELMDERDPAGPWKNTWTRAWLDEYVSTNSKNLASMAQDPVYAIRDVVHAVVARNPRMRYLSGTLAKTLFFALWKMPERWAFVMKRATIAPRPVIGP
jgi:NAD(P)-dependent dehydrogenase (short-subunit alcohol dehydrogenase family)